MKKLFTFILLFVSLNAFSQQIVVNTIELQNHIRTVAEESLAFVVAVNTITVREGRYFFQQRESAGLGSGVIVRQDDNEVLILTNRHVVEGTDDVEVVLTNGESYNVEEWFFHSIYDIALLLIETEDKLPIAKIGDSEKTRVGDFIIAVGNPLGFTGTVTFGIVSAIREFEENKFIQTDASINPGNSGGPLINMSGEIIGINTWIASQTGANIGLGFSIPINEIIPLIEDFINDRE